MNRRGLLRALMYGGAALAAPDVIALVRAPPVEGHQLFRGEVGRYEGLVIKRSTEVFDFGHLIGICVTVSGGPMGRVRLAANFPTRDWESASDRLRDRHWRFLERGAVRAAIQWSATA